MQNGINQWKRSKHKALNGGQDDETTLFVFGYQCKLYRDDEKARWINNGRHLIPWMGDHNVLIDRFVCSSIRKKIYKLKIIKKKKI